MSENELKFIPIQPDFVPPRAAADKAVALLREWLPSAPLVDAGFSDTIEFTNQGENWEGVFCPACGEEIEMPAWQDLMNAAYDPEKGFGDLRIETPCCRSGTSLNDLRYEWPAGFAKFVLVAENPNVGDLDPAQHARLETILGTALRRIWVRH